MTGTNSSPPARPDRRWQLLVAVVAVGAGLALWTLAGFSPYFLPVICFALAGAAAVALLIPARPAAAVGVVFLLAVFESVAIETVFGSLRIEQPAIGALLVATLWHRHRLDLPALRQIWPLLLAAAVYLGSLTLSSAFVADVPALSLRLVAWSALSMLGGLLAALLLYGRVRQVLPWLAGSGALVAVLGLVAALVYTAFGSEGSALLLTRPYPRVFLPAHEPNLYASLLAIVAPIALEVFRDRPSRRNGLVAALVLLGIGLAITRAAYVGLAVGLIVFFLLHLRLNGWTLALRRVVALTAVAGIIGLGLPALILNPQFAGLLSPPDTAVVNPTSPPAPGSTADPAATPAPVATATPEPEDPELVDLDTFDYRIARVEIGLHEWKESPIIGRGAYSFGQRHFDRKGYEDVIAVLPVLVLHDSGIVGFVALGAFLAVLALMLLRVSSDRLRAPPAIALGTAVLAMLIGYLATTALHFAVTWIVIGAAVAAAWPEPASDQPERPA